jgi:hypothetical protein
VEMKNQPEGHNDVTAVIEVDALTSDS